MGCRKSGTLFEKIVELGTRGKIRGLINTACAPNFRAYNLGTPRIEGEGSNPSRPNQGAVAQRQSA